MESARFGLCQGSGWGVRSSSCVAHHTALMITRPASHSSHREVVQGWAQHLNPNMSCRSCSETQKQWVAFMRERPAPWSKARGRWKGGHWAAPTQAPEGAWQEEGKQQGGKVVARAWSHKWVKKESGENCFLFLLPQESLAATGEEEGECFQLWVVPPVTHEMAKLGRNARDLCSTCFHMAACLQNRHFSSGSLIMLTWSGDHFFF